LNERDNRRFSDFSSSSLGKDQKSFIGRFDQKTSMRFSQENREFLKIRYADAARSTEPLSERKQNYDLTEDLGNFGHKASG
jgi:hypothetical protein